MADRRFFANFGPFFLDELAREAGAELASAADGGRRVSDVAPLESAGPDDLAFLDNRKYADVFARSGAGAALVHPDMAGLAPAGMALLLTPEPYRAYAKIAALFYPAQAPTPDISPAASVHPSAVLGAGCRIEPGAVIGARAAIGARCLIGPNAVVGAGVVLGDDCMIGAGATLGHAVLGDRVAIHPGARIGQDGFGYALGPAGPLKVPQLGRVMILDDAEIGANTTIDRGAGPDTVIGAGTKIDNLVHIAHNVRIGRCCVIAAQTGISGSTEIGDFVAIGGQAGFTGHLKIGTAARIAAQSGVMRDVAPHETVAGSPATSRIDWLRQCALIGRLRQEAKADAPIRRRVRASPARNCQEAVG